MKQEINYMFEMMKKMALENERAALVQLEQFGKLEELMRKRRGLPPLDKPSKD